MCVCRQINSTSAYGFDYDFVFESNWSKLGKFRAVAHVRRGASDIVIVELRSIDSIKPSTSAVPAKDQHAMCSFVTSLLKAAHALPNQSGGGSNLTPEQVSIIHEKLHKELSKKLTPGLSMAVAAVTSGNSSASSAAGAGASSSTGQVMVTKIGGLQANEDDRPLHRSKLYDTYIRMVGIPFPPASDSVWNNPRGRLEPLALDCAEYNVVRARLGEDLGKKTTVYDITEIQRVTNARQLMQFNHRGELAFLQCLMDRSPTT